MFRKGGNVGNGIMSNIRDRENFNKKAVSDDMRKRIEERAAIYRSYAGDPIANALISGGLGLIAGEGAGKGTLGAIGTAFKGPVERALSQQQTTGLKAASDVFGMEDKLALARAKPRTANSYESRVQGYMDAFKISRAEAIKRVNKDLETSPEQAPGTKEINFLEIYKRHPYRDVIAAKKSKTNKSFVVIPAEAYDKDRKLKPDFTGAPGTPYYDPSTNTYFEFKTTIDPVTKKQTVTKVQIAEADLQ